LIKRLLRRWCDVPSPEDGLAETLAITLRCARRCAYDLSHAADMIPSAPGDWRSDFAERFARKAAHWQSLFSSGTTVKDYRLELHRELDDRDRTIARLRAALLDATGSDRTKDEVPF
jgi:hypothetical protein